MPLLAGVGCGVLSAWGIGGGTLLLLVMTLVFGVDQTAAQGINLLYFLPTAAMGLALRALGAGQRVVIVQFLKGGNSGEIPLLARLGAEVYRGKAGQKFVFQMNEAEKAATRDLQNRNLAAAMTEDADLLVLDEAGSAWELDMVDKALLQKAVLARPAAQECVLTAHAAPQWMLDAADYVTEMKCCRHPYQKGIAARKGIEY